MASRKRKEELPLFFKVIMTQALEDKKLKIPPKFVQLFGKKLDDVVTLMDPNGRGWKVKLMKDGNNVWFQDGWDEFVHFYSIAVGYFLLFKYRMDSTFKVRIFDTSACEKVYLNKGKQPVDVEDQNINTTQNTQNSVKKNTTAKPSSSRLNQGKRRRKSTYVRQNKRPRVEELMKSKKARANDLNRKKIAIKVEKPSLGEETDSDEDEQMTSLAKMGICVNRRFNILEEELRDRAVAAAKLFKPKRPSFLVIVQPSDISNSRLYVPAEFTHTYITKNDKVVKVVDSDGMKWTMSLSWLPLCFLTRLGGFVRKLDVGDICVFELIRRRKLKFKVYVLNQCGK